MALDREIVNRVCVFNFDVIRRWKSSATRLVVLYISPAKIYIDGVILTKSRKDEVRRLLPYRDIDIIITRNDFSVGVYPTQSENLLSLIKFGS